MIEDKISTSLRVHVRERSSRHAPGTRKGESRFEFCYQYHRRLTLHCFYRFLPLADILTPIFYDYNSHDFPPFDGNTLISWDM